MVNAPRNLVLGANKIYNNNNLLFIHTLSNLNRNSKVRAVSSLRTFSTSIPWHDLIHTLLGAKSLLSVIVGKFLTEANFLESAGLELGRTFLLRTHSRLARQALNQLSYQDRLINRNINAVNGWVGIQSNQIIPFESVLAIHSSQYSLLTWIVRTMSRRGGDSLWHQSVWLKDDFYICGYAIPCESCRQRKHLAVELYANERCSESTNID